MNYWDLPVGLIIGFLVGVGFNQDRWRKQLQWASVHGSLFRAGMQFFRVIQVETVVVEKEVR